MKADPAFELQERRRRLEERLARVRTSLDREIGWAPKAGTWALPLLGLACGLFLARRALPRKNIEPLRDVREGRRE